MHQRDQRTQVLVVGAGPVGLLAALRLRQQGMRVRLIDQQSQRRAHTFPVVLHPQTLRLLIEAGITAALFWRGRPVTHLAIYGDYERRTVLDFPEVAGAHAGLLTLPQDILRQTLTTALEQLGVEVEWNTRLAVLQQDERSVWGRLVHEEPSLLMRSRKAEATSFEADFVIGADGYESTVREALGILLVEHGKVQSFAFFDASTQRSGTEAQVSLADDYANSAYPLQGGQTRFSFQLGRALHKAPDAGALHELLSARMPWYAGDLVSFNWGGVAEFRRALAEHFGQGRVWLAGEAAHLSGPLGVHSLNVGLDEANELALLIGAASKQSIGSDFGATYDAARRRQWRALLGLEPLAHPTTSSAEWLRRHHDRIVGVLPASKLDLEALQRQLRLLGSVTS
jgi:2-polyprenyl-6-methoxyphenol hydroxylase-like FAD-dependent oxidoreductase